MVRTRVVLPPGPGTPFREMRSHRIKGNMHPASISDVMVRVTAMALTGVTEDTDIIALPGAMVRITGTAATGVTVIEDTGGGEIDGCRILMKGFGIRAIIIAMADGSPGIGL
ncbi:MAG: hypothetical protein ACE5DO_05430 [Desulfobacterales bacterium]